MATTTGGTTYVTSTDLVANYPTASLALANRTDVVASGGPVLVKTAGYTITVADILAGNKFLYNSASPGTFTLPTSSLVDGMVVDVSQIGAGALTVSGGTIVGTTVTTAQYQGLRFVYVASGTTWYSIAPNATAPGMTLITAQSFTTSSSVSVNSVFSSTYENYKVIVTLTAASASSLISMRLRASGTDSTGGNYFYGGYNATFAGTLAAVFGSSATSFPISDIDTTQPYLWLANYDILKPFATDRTTASLTSMGLVASGFGRGVGLFHNLATSYDGFTIFPGSGTISGVARVYGYKNS